MERVQHFTYMQIVNRMLVANALVLAASYIANSIGYIDGEGFYIALMFVAVFVVAPFFIAALERQDERSINAEPLSEATLTLLAEELGAAEKRSDKVVTFASAWDASPLRQHMKLHIVEEESGLRIVGPRCAVEKVVEVLGQSKTEPK